jgi:diadenosine tetraphosphatase ApaH/serine/threonine PP2A family protein phosphatase
MRIAVLTDLHANLEAVQATFAHAAAQGAERYALLGDFVGYGADPAAVVALVREHMAAGALAVKGNHDEAVVRGASPTMRSDARYVIDWTRSRLDADQLKFLDELPMTQTLGEALFVHANAYAPEGWDYITGRMEATRSLHATQQRLVFCGHMHEPMLYHLSSVGKAGDFVPVPGAAVPLLPPRRWLVIPGAVGQPRDGNPAACYAMYDDAARQVTYWRVPYDHDTSAAKIRDAQLPQTLAHRLIDGT